ncbi:IS630 family transposase [Rhizophagus irregularis DAOM 181602=DAOM 197198]|nr:IS630 family transposase [Rhizophagus irregularis DAOM 181602=DAOM 197198]
MPKKHELTEFERGEIIALWKGGHSERNISEILDFPKTTIHDTIMDYKNSEKISAASRSGRPPKLAERDIRRICRERKEWDTEWDFIIWSDESRFLLFQNDAHHWVWRKPHEKCDVNCLILTVKSGNQGVMVWGYFAKNQLGPLIQVSGSITGLVYINILENHLLPFYNNLENNLQYFFQDDNAPVHRARTVSQWKEDNSVSTIPWPAQSPDLNPIEHLWDVLERKVRAHKPHPKNIRELMVVLEEKWNNIEPEILINLVDSMLRRVHAVLDSHGNPTRY